MNASVASLWGASAPRFFRGQRHRIESTEACGYANTRSGRFRQGPAVDISYFDRPPNVNPIDTP